jgi:hypothetical protein
MTMKCRAQVLELMKDAGLEAKPEQYRSLLDACKGASGAGKNQDDYYLGLKIREMMGGEDGTDGGNVNVDAKGPALLDAGATFAQSSALRFVNVVDEQGVVDASRTAVLGKMTGSFDPPPGQAAVGTYSPSSGASNVEVPILVDASATAARVRALATLAGEEGAGEERPGFDMGMRLLSEMLNNGLEPDTITYTAVLHAAKEEGTLRAAIGGRELLRRIPFESRNHRTYAVAISSLTLVGLTDDAREVLDEARSHLQPNIYMYCGLLAPLASRPAESSTFFEVLNEMRADGVMDTPLSLRLEAQVSVQGAPSCQEKTVSRRR